MVTDARRWLIITTAALFLRAELGRAKTLPWSYDDETGPDRWCEIDSQCCGMFQSPIDIGSAFRVRFPHPVAFTNYDLVQAYELTNNGRTALMTIVDARWTPMVVGGPLANWYVFEEAHFHWGRKSSRGSEHTVNGRQLPLEMHVVHRNARYPSFEEATEHADGLSVVSVLFKIATSSTNDDDTGADVDVGLRPLTKALNSITCKGQKTIVSISLGSLMPTDRTEYVSYFGSVTRPPCSQAVMWIVLESFGRIGTAQMEALRRLHEERQGTSSSLKCGPRLVDNFRPTQNINNRLVVETQ